MQSPLSSPFQLRLRLREKLEARLEAVPLFNVLLIAVLLAMTGTHFIFSPGISVRLNENAPDSVVSVVGGNLAETRMSLPRTSIVLPGVETSSVLTVKSDSMFILDGRIYENLSDAFSRGNAPGKDRGTLLIKVDRSVSVQGLFKIAELAGSAGFSVLQIAGESPAVHPEKVR